MKSVLVSCPPMVRQLERFCAYARDQGLHLDPLAAEQTVTEARLIRVLAHYDGWIAGDDPVTEQVLRAGCRGALRGVVKWGVGTDNIDYSAASECDIAIRHTPKMFGAEVADVALAYIIGLARHLFRVDRENHCGRGWSKPAGVSLEGKTAGVVGYGDIGSRVVTRLLACGMEVIVYERSIKRLDGVMGVQAALWPDRTGELDFLILACGLSRENRYMVGPRVMQGMKDGVYVVNVARGGLIDEDALVSLLSSGKVGGAALDVFEEEPLAASSELRGMANCILGTHNASNTYEAVERASRRAIDEMVRILDA